MNSAENIDAAGKLLDASEDLESLAKMHPSELPQYDSGVQLAQAHALLAIAQELNWMNTHRAEFGRG